MGSERDCCQNALPHVNIWHPVVVIFIIILSSSSPFVTAELGGSISVPLILDRTTSPYLVKDDIIVEATGELVIKPGVKLTFSPTVGITVFGRLVAEV